MRAILTIAALSSVALAAPVPKAGGPKLPPPTEAQLKESRNNLQQIVLATHSFNDTNGTMPNNIVDPKTKKPLLSWRVHLLPYLEETPLYQKFKLDEPWDSKNNKPLVEKMPKIFAPIRVKAKPGETFYRGFTGADTVFEAGARYGLAQIPDGSSNVIGVLEAGEPCLWTKPDDLPFDPKKPLPKLGGLFDGDFHVAMMDGSVHRVNAGRMKVDEFRKMLTRSNGFVRNQKAAFGE